MTLREALQELSDKDLKDRIGQLKNAVERGCLTDNEYEELVDLTAEYERRKPLAWAGATIKEQKPVAWAIYFRGEITAKLWSDKNFAKEQLAQLNKQWPQDANLRELVPLCAAEQRNAEADIRAMKSDHKEKA